MLTKISLPLLALALLLSAAPAGSAQRRAAARARAFEGSWNWAIYAESKDELPLAYRGMEIREVPAYALDITIRQRGDRLTATCGVLARYLARVDECDFSAVARNGSALINLKSNFGGSATVRLTLEGERLRWKLVRSRGEFYYPRDVTLRKLGKGEKLPYAADEEEEDEQ
ncbi:MAG TPA: hypothetical protein VM936_21805 [Pyrinomonadaceae bacterium]|jgi:hypothetical protein|nr:hypothetical protein [Pyrinomonadaceae bacterium]